MMKNLLFIYDKIKPLKNHKHLMAFQILLRNILRQVAILTPSPLPSLLKPNFLFEEESGFVLLPMSQALWLNPASALHLSELSPSLTFGQIFP